MKKSLVHLNDPETHKMGMLLKKHENLDFLGANIDVGLMTKIADCEVCPISKEPFNMQIEEKATSRTFSRKRNSREKKTKKLNQACRYGKNCTRTNCWYKHPGD